MKNIRFPIGRYLDDENQTDNYKFFFVHNKDEVDKKEVKLAAKNLYDFLYATCHAQMYDELKKLFDKDKG